MLGAVAGMLASGETAIANDAVGVSYPGFWDDIGQATVEGVGSR